MYLDFFLCVWFVSVWRLLLFAFFNINSHYLYFKEPTKHALSSLGIFEALTKS